MSLLSEKSPQNDHFFHLFKPTPTYFITEVQNFVFIFKTPPSYFEKSGYYQHGAHELTRFCIYSKGPLPTSKKAECWVVRLCVLVQFALDAFMFWHFGGSTEDLLNAQFCIYSIPPSCFKKTAPNYVFLQNAPLLLQKKRFLPPRSP